MRDVTLIIKAVAAVLLVTATTGCYRNVVSGEVVDMLGEALPGVAVTVPGTPYQDLTNTLGAYAVRVEPGHTTLKFSKTGYTSSELLLEESVKGRWKAPVITLWNLPRGKGVFFLEGNRYHAIESVRPGTYGKFLGTEVAPQTTTSNARPRIIAHRMPETGATLVRMDYFPVTVPQPDNTGGIYDIWAPRETLPLVSEVIDMPDKLLVELKLQSDLEPGVYAIHWGALDTARPREPEMYFFSFESDEDEHGVPPQGASAEHRTEAGDRNAGEAPGTNGATGQDLALPDLSDEGT